jgi:proline iminopeptidase
MDKTGFQSEWFDEPPYRDEGFVPYTCRDKTYALWCGIAGIGDRPPLLVLHGGPGGNHHNLVPLQALAVERAVVFYDQLGCGNSERPNDPSLWTAERYFEEVAAVREGLGLECYHLAGHSWGTTLAAGFAQRHPEGIITLSLHSPILSFPRYVEKVVPRLKASLPGRAAQIINDFELRGVGGGKEYDDAVMEFVRRHVIRTWPLPEPMKRLIAGRNSQIHNVMVKSQSELNVLGNLKDVDVSKGLKDLTAPVLLTAGRLDLCTPDFTAWHQSLVRHAEMHIIENSAHMTFMDQPGEVVRIQRDFLRTHE